MISRTYTSNFKVLTKQSWGCSKRTRIAATEVTTCWFCNCNIIAIHWGFLSNRLDVSNQTIQTPFVHSHLPQHLNKFPKAFFHTSKKAKRSRGCSFLRFLAVYHLQRLAHLHLPLKKTDFRVAFLPVELVQLFLPFLDPRPGCSTERNPTESNEMRLYNVIVFGWAYRIGISYTCHMNIYIYEWYPFVS